MGFTPLVVVAKFAPPRIGSRTLARAQLMPRLQEARHRKLTLLVGGAGFGKTTLMAQWRQELSKTGTRPVWISLAPDDGSLPQFCATLYGALQQAGVPVGEDVLLLGDGEVRPQVLAAQLLNALAQVPGELYLMFDDFHHVTDPGTLGLVQAMVDATLPSVHVVIATRAAPTLLLGRLRAMGELTEIDCNQLMFDFRETLAFLKTHLDARIDLDAANQLHELTGGWPIGLQLMAISLKANPANRARLRTLAPDSDALEAYLSEDVLADLPPGLADFMQKLSVLRRFNAGVAAHVTGCADAASLIAAIDGRNLFLLPVDTQEGGQWLRFHPMFAEYLAKRLAGQGTDVPALHRRAAEWFAREGVIEEATRHALLGDHFDAVVTLIERSIGPAATLSQMGHLLRWLERVPRDRLVDHPAVLHAGAWAGALTGRVAQAEGWIGALAASGRDIARSRSVRLLRAFLAAERDDIATMETELLALGDTPMRSPMHEHLRIALNISRLTWRGLHAQARALYNSPAARRTRTEDRELALLARTAMASAVLTEGNVLEAERIGAPALALAEAQFGRRSVSACVCAAMLGAIWHELDRVEAARELLANRIDMLRLSMPYVALRATQTLACAKLMQEGPHAAMEYLVQEEANFRVRGADRCVAHVVAARLRVALHTGDWRHAEALQATLDDLAMHHADDSPRGREIQMAACLTRARLALARHAPQRALQALGAGREIATALGSGRVLVTADLLEARALDELGRTGEMLDCLRSALAAGYRLGLVRTLRDEGEKVRALLCRLEGHLESIGEDRAALSDYLRVVTDAGADTVRLSGAAGNTGPTAPTPAAQPAAASAEAQLTRRELEILGLLEQSMSNKRIALTLNLSVQTVKWNLKKIFSKLGVSSRYEAIIAVRGAGTGVS